MRNTGRKWLIGTPPAWAGVFAVLLLAVAMLVAVGCSDDDPTSPGIPDPEWSQVLAPEYTHRAVWGVSSSHFFVASEKGAISRYQDGEWTRWQFRYFENMRGIWGTGPDQVVAVGENGNCYLFDGTDWTPVYSGTNQDLLGVWGTSWDNIYAVGGAGTLIHFDGTQWSDIDSGVTSLLYSVWGSGPSDIFAVGREGTIIHFDGDAWLPMASGTTQALDCVWGLMENDVYAVGALGTILHFDGQDWVSEDSGISDRLWAVRGLPGEHPVALGARGGFLTRRDGSWEHEQLAQGQDLYGLWDNGDSALLIVGYNGLVMSMTPNTRQILNQGRTHWLTGVWAADCRRVYAVGKHGTILQSSGDGWVDIAPHLDDAHYSAIWGAGPDDFSLRETMALFSASKWGTGPFGV